MKAPGAEAANENPEPEQEVQRLQAEVERLTTALQDVVTLAHSSGEARQRAVLMERRAIAALSRADEKPPRSLPELARIRRKPDAG